MNMESSRTLGAIGALLMVVSPFGGIYTSILGIAGLILLLLALNSLADVYKERRIFNNAVYGVIAVIVGIGVAVGVAVTAAFGMLSVLGIQISNWTDWSALQNFNWQGFTNWSALVPYVAAIVGALVILFVCVVVGTVFLRRSLNALAEKSGIHLFATTGLLMLIGAALTIILVGFLLLWISLILLIVSFFEMKTQPTQTQPQTPLPATST